MAGRSKSHARPALLSGALDHVRLSSTQAKTAVKATRDQKNKKERFLLCVVPVGPGNIDPELDTVRANMRFIKNIGPRVAQMCNGLDKLEKLRGKIIADESSGVQLEVVSGTARIRVANSVWENDGFPLV